MSASNNSPPPITNTDDDGEEIIHIQQHPIKYSSSSSSNNNNNNNNNNNRGEEDKQLSRSAQSEESHYKTSLSTTTTSFTTYDPYPDSIISDQQSDFTLSDRSNSDRRGVGVSGGSMTTPTPTTADKGEQGGGNGEEFNPASIRPQFRPPTIRPAPQSSQQSHTNNPQSSLQDSMTLPDVFNTNSSTIIEDGSVTGNSLHNSAGSSSGKFSNLNTLKFLSLIFFVN